MAPVSPLHLSSPVENESRIPRSPSGHDSESIRYVRLRRGGAFQPDLDPPLSDITTLFPRAEPSPSLYHDKDKFLGTNLLQRRQTYISNLPATYAGINSGPSSGTIVGIVLGVVLGYILVFWLIIALISAKSFGPQYVEGDDTEIVVRRGHNSSRRSRRSHRSQRGPPTEVSELPARPPRRHHSRERSERIIVQETTTTTRRADSMAATAPRSPVGEVRETINVNIREGSRPPPPPRVEGDDMVVVEEEESSTDISAVTPDPPRRNKRQSGYRPVDPNAYAGGNYARQEFSSRDRTRR